MTESIWITTITMPIHEFDIFTFNAWLQSATLLELYIELMYVETCTADWSAIWEITFGAFKNKAALRASFYNSLYVLIDNTIIDRTNAAFAQTKGGEIYASY
jgi:hypothetical protein